MNTKDEDGGPPRMKLLKRKSSPELDNGSKRPWTDIEVENPDAVLNDPAYRSISKKERAQILIWMRREIPASDARIQEALDGLARIAGVPSEKIPRYW